ncbi:MAG: prenyltransferase/squalene oxidase repeat-containing protein [Candidatus Eremiobacterota bacterium]
MSAADTDGVWRSPYVAGPLHAAVACLALERLGAVDPEHTQQLLGLAACQRPDGGFALDRGGAPSRDLTRLVLLVFESALERDPALGERLEGALERGRKFLSSSVPAQETLMVTCLHNWLASVCRPEQGAAPRALLSLGGVLPAADFVLSTTPGQAIGGIVGITLTQSLPAMGILDDATARSGPLACLYRLLDRFLPFRAYREGVLERLERSMRENQDPNGGWMYLAATTALNLIALEQRGKGLDDPAVARGVDYIRSLRGPGPGGPHEQFLLNAEVWDTAVAALPLLAQGMRADVPMMQRSLGYLLREQGQDGRWAFATGAPTFPDNDSSAMVLTCIARSCATAAPLQRQPLQESLRRGVTGLLDHQQADGGWNSYTPTRWSFGSRTPGLLEATVMDPSTPDVTGRVLGALLASLQSGVLDEEAGQRVGQAVDRAMEYLARARTSTGSWWSRWIAGYLPSPAFVLPALRGLGVSPQDAAFQEVRSFLLAAQNADGGWGESPSADGDRSLAGVGPSTPAQTAFALMALVAAHPSDSVEGDEAMNRAVDYLLSRQAGSTWENGTELYTTSPQFDYYDAPLMTHTVVTLALQYYEHARRKGVARSLEDLSRGPV